MILVISTLAALMSPQAAQDCPLDDADACDTLQRSSGPSGTAAAPILASGAKAPRVVAKQAIEFKKQARDEGRDARWAPAAEQQLTTLYDSVGGVTVTQVQCAKTVCAIEATADPARSADFLKQAGSPALIGRTDAAGFRLTAAAVTDDSPPIRGRSGSAAGSSAKPDRGSGAPATPALPAAQRKLSA